MFLGARDCKLMVYCDHKGLGDNWSNGGCASVEVMEVIRKMKDLESRNGLQLVVKWVRSGSNPADSVSRGDVLACYHDFPMGLELEIAKGIVPTR